MHVYGSGKHVYIGSPNILQQFVAAEHLVGVLSEEEQEFKFFFGQADLSATYLNCVAGAIDDQFADLDLVR
jgi:hypothetical protein